MGRGTRTSDGHAGVALRDLGGGGHLLSDDPLQGFIIGEVNVPDERELYEMYCDRYLNVTQVRDADALEDMLQFLRDRNARRVHVDMETCGLSPLDGPLRLIQIGYDDRDDVKRQWLIDCYAVDPQPVGALLRSTRVEKVIQYSPFETQHALVALGVPINRVFDTWAAWCCVQKRLAWMPVEEIDRVLPGWRQKFRNGLQSIVYERLGFDLPKDEQKGEWVNEQLTDAQLRYAAMDVAVLGDVADDVQEIIDALHIPAAEVEGLRRWAIARNFEENRLDVTVHDRDDRAAVAMDLELASDRDKLDDTWAAARRRTLTARNRAALRERYEQRRATLSASIQQTLAV